ncbi:hypothetical protein Hypma_002036 [Hypsizygus marmoreus]|uniref:Uncharacterized protein n=1 Tax=Hypsizygus marmoreus TaxID=39966 RepID=A0A369JBF4_HYPMA|nr:hypothetical protein Hypma_002036 [Hypsizygus marmoreus]
MRSNWKHTRCIKELQKRYTQSQGHSLKNLVFITDLNIKPSCIYTERVVDSGELEDFECKPRRLFMAKRREVILSHLEAE